MARQSEWDEGKHGRIAPPPTLPRLAFTDYDTEVEAQEAAARVAERRVIRNGRDAWLASNKANSFEVIKVVGAALLIGRTCALRVTGANAPHGRRYSMALRAWMKDNGFGTMSATTRKHIVMLTAPENAAAVAAWRDKLPERERNGMANPQHLYRRWRAATQSNGKCPQDLKRDAAAAWRRFVSCVELLPPDQAAPLWKIALAEIANNLRVKLP